MTNPFRLAVGSTGPAVRRLERELKDRGLLQGPVDNTFDARTKKAVEAFERRQGWKADGVVGKRIWDRFDLGPAGDRRPPSPGPRGDGEGVFNVVSMNVRSNPLMSPGRMREDIRNAAKLGDVIGWQEIKPQHYREAIRDLKGFSTFMPKGLQTPISWRSRDWKLLDSGVERMHGGLEGVSPHRQVAWVKLKNRETGETIVHMNTHLVSGAWNAKKQATDPWRKKMWNRHIEKMGKLVERFERQGFPVTISGDFNRNHFRVLGDRVVYDSGLKAKTHGGATLDYVMHTRHRDLKAMKSWVNDDFNSDHNAVVVRYDLD